MKAVKIIGFAGAVLALSLLFTSCDKKIKRIEAERFYMAAVDAYSAEQYSDGLELLNRAIKLDKNFYQASFLQGKIFFFSNRITEAENIFSKLILKYPEFTEARIWHIRCLILKGDYNKAQNLLNTELSYNQTDWRIFNLYSLLAKHTNNYEERLAMNRRAETVLTGSASVYLDMALTWYTLGLNDRAQVYLEKAQQVTGTNISLREMERAINQLLRE